MSTLKLDELIVGAGLTLKRTATGVYKFFKTSSTNVVNTPIEMNDSGLVLDNPSAINNPTKGDRSTLLATMGALGNELGNYSNYINITANTVITHLFNGAFINISTTGILLTINPTGLPIGAKFTFTANFSTGNISIVGNTTSTFNSAGISNGNSITLLPGESISIVYAGGTSYVIDTNSGGTRLSKSFEKSLSANGWQKLPSGLILQWGRASFNINMQSYQTAGGTPYYSSTVTFPTTFPNNIFSITMTPSFGQWGEGYFSTEARNNSTFTSIWTQMLGTALNETVIGDFIALGC